MYNKRKFNKINDKKVLHKVKKQWVTISLALLMMIGGGAVATHVSASANTTNPAQQTNIQLGNRNGNKQPIINKANNLHNIKSNNKPAKRINNVNQLRINQVGVNKGNIYSRIATPFNWIRINHRVLLHSNILTVGSNHHVLGALSRGNVVKVSKAFKLYYHNDSFLRYEIPLKHKRSAFITGNNNFNYYAAPTSNYRYYRNRINYILKHAHNKKFNKIRTSVNKLTKRENKNYRMYMGLYVEAYNTQQSLRHPVVVNYGKKRNHINENTTKSNNTNTASDTVKQLETPANSTASASAESLSDNYASQNSSVTSQTSITPASSSYVASNVPSESYTNSTNSTTNNVIPSSASTFNDSTSTNSLASAMSMSTKESEINSINSSYAISGAKSADTSIANSYKNSVSTSVSVVNETRAKSMASVADKSIENSIADSYAKSTENTNSYKNSLSIANSKVASVTAQSADNRIESSIVSSYAKSADSSVAKSVMVSVANANSSVAKSAQTSANSSIANYYKDSVSASVSVMDSSLANSAAQSADSSIANSVSDSVKSQEAINSILINMKDQVASDVNNDRKQNGSPKLQLDPEMNKIADVRAKQLANKFSHYDKNNNPYYVEDAQKLRINLGTYYSENIGEESPGFLSSDVGNKIANTIDDGMMNHDASSNWGHRKNILDPNFTNIGVGTYYDDHGTFYIAEDFKN